MIRLHTDKDNWLNQAVNALKTGQLIIYPTETSYGLGVDATNPEAVDQLLAYKGKRLNKAISVAVADLAMAKHYIKFNSTAKTVFAALLPGPVTLVAASRGLVAPKVESERRTLGIRYSSHPLVTQVVAALGKPITATSANTSGTKAIYSYSDFQKYVPESRQSLINIFLDAGRLPLRPPSTVIDTTLNNPEILRQGTIVFDTATTTYDSDSPAATLNLGTLLMTNHLDLLASKPIIFALEGDLGAGKTHFAKGVAAALHISDTITSPTYTIMREYPYQTPKVSGTLYHLDTWRLFEGESLDDLNLGSKLVPGTVMVVEWQQKANSWLSNQTQAAVAYIKIDSIEENKRQFKVKWA